MLKYYKYIVFCLSFIVSNIYGQLLLENFKDSTSWKINASDGVIFQKTFLNQNNESFVKLIYSFEKGSGYGGIQKQFSIDLPDNYDISFYIKAKSVNNTLEFKLIDSTGDNVWWYNKKNFEFPTEWQKIIIKKRNIHFAWGPIGEGMPKHISKIEIMVTAFSGGEGEVYLKDLRIVKIPIADTDISNPSLKQSPNSKLEFSGKLTNLKWEGKRNSSLLFSFNNAKDIGGLVLSWDSTYFPQQFELCTSNDNRKWEKIKSSFIGKPGNSYIQLIDNESKFYKVAVKKLNNKKFILSGIQFLPASFSDNYNNLFYKMAEESPIGFFPKYYGKKQAYWTVSGAFNNRDEILLNTEGQVETSKQSFSIEPFVKIDKKIYSWANTELSQGLKDNYLPLPFVERRTNEFLLRINAFVSNRLPNYKYVIYEITNLKNSNLSVDFYIALRPFQVNPPWQNLNFDGGFAPIKSLKKTKDKIIINSANYLQYTPNADSFYIAHFDEGDIAECIDGNRLLNRDNAEDKVGLLSGALKYSIDLKPGETKKYYIRLSDSIDSKGFSDKEVLGDLQYTSDLWKEKLDRIKIIFPKGKEKVLNTLKSNLAYVLINMDSSKIQPGSRSYERSWIRDGSLTSNALLKFGMFEEVKNYLNWYSKFIYENGKVPCVVDKRGPDPVNENDSNGEYIFAILQYYYFTKDLEFLKDKFPLITKAVNYLDYMIKQRSTDYYKYGNDSLKSLYGLMPESISHEGYSAKPMHSYWDDFFTIRGLKDAVKIAEILDEKENIVKFREIRDTFKTNLYNSISQSIKIKKIDYIPGCADLGDFDATSTAISLFPAQEEKNLPQPYLDNTFKKYYTFFTKRKNNSYAWVNYTPYEVRIIDVFTILNKPIIANELLDYFLKDQRPPNWNHWAEVVWNNIDTNIFLGDMPHTWVGSDYINSIRNMLVYEDEDDSSLTLCKGLIKDWFINGDTLAVKDLPTLFGNISFSIVKEKDKTTININGNLELPKNGIKVKDFLNNSDKFILVKKLPYSFILYAQ